MFLSVTDSELLYLFIFLIRLADINSALYILVYKIPTQQVAVASQIMVLLLCRLYIEGENLRFDNTYDKYHILYSFTKI